MMESKKFTELEQFYREDPYDGFSSELNVERFYEYAQFVKKYQASGKVYEIGSGQGTAAAALKKANVDIICSDIYPENALKTFAKYRLQIEAIELNSNQNYFDDCSIDNYSLHQVLEHIETPQMTLKECFRTLKKGGRIIIVGPNLISPLMNLKTLVLGIIKKWPTPIWQRTDGYSFPFGDNLIQIFLYYFRNTYLTFLKLFFKSQRHFFFRRPCLKKPAKSDSDAILMLNPLDLSQELQSLGFKIISFQSQRKTHVFAGSTWIVAEK